MSTGKIELSVGAIVNKYDIFTEEEIYNINGKVPELDERVGNIEDDIEEINSSLEDITNEVNEIKKSNIDLSDYAKKSDLEVKADKSYVDSAIESVDVSSQLTNYAKKSDLEVKVDKETGKSLISDSEIERLSTLKNYDDTEIKNSLNSKANKTELHSHSNKSVLDGITSAKITEWNNKSNFSGNYNDLTNKPTIPTLNGYATEQYVNEELKKIDVTEQLTDYAKKSEVIEYIFPEQFGAKGDGSTDDSNAIQQAIQQAIDTATNSYYLKPIVYLGAKTYKINTGLILEARCMQFHCDGIIEYTGTGSAISVKHSLMNIYINQIKAPNGTGLYLTGAEHQCVTNNIKVNRIEESTVGLYLHNHGKHNSVFYNQIDIGSINSTDICVLISAESGYINENHFWFGKLYGGNVGVKIYSSGLSGCASGGNRFFKGSCENLKDNTENTCAIWLENADGNTFSNFRCEENHGGKAIVFKGVSFKNDIWISSCPLGGIDITEMKSGSEYNVVRGVVATGKPYQGGYVCGTEAQVSYSKGIVYDTRYANIHIYVDNSTFPDKIIKQVEDTAGNYLIPSSLLFAGAVTGTYTLSPLYSEYGSINRGNPLVISFDTWGANIIIKDNRNNIVLDNSTGKYTGKTMSIRCDGIQKQDNKNIWVINILGDEKESLSNKVSTIDEFSTDVQYPSAKCVYDIINNLEKDNDNDKTYYVDGNGNLIQVENAPYKDLVPTGQDTDKSILNGVGYVDDYRISASNVVVAQSGTVLTGFIPYSDAKDADVIRTKGVTYVEELYCGIFYYDKDFNVLGGLRLIPNNPGMLNNTGEILYLDGSSFVVNNDGIASIKVNFREDMVVAKQPTYFRLFAKGKGSDLIITRNEEIVEFDKNGQSLGKVRPIKGVDYFTEAEKTEMINSVIAEQKTETWTFTLADGSTVTKKVVLN